MHTSPVFFPNPVGKKCPIGLYHLVGLSIINVKFGLQKAPDTWSW